jgi:hypothetical protein
LKSSAEFICSVVKIPIERNFTMTKKTIQDALRKAAADQEFARKLVANPAQFKEEYELTEDQMAPGRQLKKPPAVATPSTKTVAAATAVAAAAAIPTYK